MWSSPKRERSCLTARGLLDGLHDAVTVVRRIGRGEAGLVRVGVTLLAEPMVAPALHAF
jgi:DNA-binding transcriptional LysR family regulator